MLLSDEKEKKKRSLSGGKMLLISGGYFTTGEVRVSRACRVEVFEKNPFSSPLGPPSLAGSKIRYWGYRNR